MDATISRLIEERDEMRKVLQAIDAVNARRANALVQDFCQRTDYEQTLGFCLDRVRVLVDAVQMGKPIPEWQQRKDGAK